jgi:hypothetical protein
LFLRKILELYIFGPASNFYIFLNTNQNFNIYLKGYLNSLLKSKKLLNSLNFLFVKDFKQVKDFKLYLYYGIGFLFLGNYLLNLVFSLLLNLFFKVFKIVFRFVPTIIICYFLYIMLCC